MLFLLTRNEHTFFFRLFVQSYLHRKRWKERSKQNSTPSKLDSGDVQYVSANTYLDGGHTHTYPLGSEWSGSELGGKTHVAYVVSTYPTENFERTSRGWDSHKVSNGSHLSFPPLRNGFFFICSFSPSLLPSPLTKLLVHFDVLHYSRVCSLLDKTQRSKEKEWCKKILIDWSLSRGVDPPPS